MGTLKHPLSMGKNTPRDRFCKHLGTNVRDLPSKIKISIWLVGLLWTFSTIIFSIAVFIGSFPEQIFEIKRDWDREVIVTGFKFTWTHQDRDTDYKKLTLPTSK